MPVRNTLFKNILFSKFNFYKNYFKFYQNQNKELK